MYQRGGQSSINIITLDFLLNSVENFRKRDPNCSRTGGTLLSLKCWFALKKGKEFGEKAEVDCCPLGIILPQDNTPAHTALAVKIFLEKHNILMLHYLFYSVDLTLSSLTKF